ncbi:MAG: transporter ATP-binding protein [Eubacterium sp.]|nr:transporter ATP-binding protein [Eubacterium sp.]
MNSLIQFKNVSKEYDMGAKKLLAADNVTFSINEGEFVVILGPSGAGKSTVLNLLGGMDFSTSGEIIINSQNISKYNEQQLTDYRAENVGFVFQFYNLIPTLTALENVALIKNVVKAPLDAADVLESVGLAEHLRKFPSQLSGGEQQRVSIARAICKNPAMLLCDEPTGALDSETGVVILSLLQKMSREQNKTVIIVTHNAALAQTADKVIRMKNGKVREVTVNTEPLAVSEVNW